MATPAEIALVREKINDLGPEHLFPEQRVNDSIDTNTDLDQAAAELWRAKASRYADLTDIQEGSSRRNLGDLYEQAMKMADLYGSQSPTPQSGMRPGRTRPITRP